MPIISPVSSTDLRRLLPLIVVTFGLVLSRAGDAAEGPTARNGAGGANPILRVKGSRFLLDGKPFDMWGVRVASATRDQKLTNHLIAQLDEYKGHGVNTVAVFYQGSSGGAYDPFSADGETIDAGHEDRMEQIIRAAAARDMVVVVGIFYQNAALVLKDADAVRGAVRSVGARLKPFRNVVINIANEQNSSRWKDTAGVYDFQDPERIIELCGVVREVDPERVVGGGGYDHVKNVVIGRSKDVDVLLFDTAGPTPDSGELHNRFVAAGVTEKPLVNVELFGGWTGRFERGVFPPEARNAYLAEVKAAAARRGLHVFFHNNPWMQREPLRYDLAGDGTSDDPGVRWYFAAVKEATAKRAAAEDDGKGDDITVSGTRFLLNGKPFPYTGVSFFNAIYNPSFNKNSEERVKWLRKFRKYGVNVLRVWCQWDNKRGFVDAGPGMTLYNADGSLQARHLKTLKEILADADREGVVVELALFARESWNEEIRLSDGAMDKAVESLAKELLPHRNLTFQVWNEFDRRVLEAQAIIKRVDPKRLVTNSPGYAGVMGKDEHNKILDYLTPHTTRQGGAGGKTWLVAPREIASMIEKFKKPVVDDEPARNGTSRFGGPGEKTEPTDHVLHVWEVWKVGGYATYHHDMFQTGYGSAAVPPSGVPDPEFSAYHRAVFEFLSRRERYMPSEVRRD